MYVLTFTVLLFAAYCGPGNANRLNYCLDHNINTNGGGQAPVNNCKFYCIKQVAVSEMLFYCPCRPQTNKATNQHFSLKILQGCGYGLVDQWLPTVPEALRSIYKNKKIKKSDHYYRLFLVF